MKMGVEMCWQGDNKVGQGDAKQFPHSLVLAHGQIANDSQHSISIHPLCSGQYKIQGNSETLSRMECAMFSNN